MATFRRWVRRIFTIVIALLLLFEEWGWDQLSAILGQLARLPFWAWIERRIAMLPPWGAVAIFFLPALALLPVKLLALYFIGKGHAFMGLVVLLAAKLAGTAILARLFSLTQPALMRLAWFARWYPRWKAWKDRIIDQVRRTEAWRELRRWRKRTRVRWNALRRSFAGNPD